MEKQNLRLFLFSIYYLQKIYIRSTLSLSSIFPTATLSAINLFIAVRFCLSFSSIYNQ